MKRFLEYSGPKICEILHLPRLSKATLVLKKKTSSLVPGYTYYPFGPGQHIIRCLKNEKCENERTNEGENGRARPAQTHPNEQPGVLLQCHAVRRAQRRFRACIGRPCQRPRPLLAPSLPSSLAHHSTSIYLTGQSNKTVVLYL